MSTTMTWYEMCVNRFKVTSSRCDGLEGGTGMEGVMRGGHEEGLSLQYRTIIAVIREKAISAPVVMPSAGIRSHSEAIRRRSWRFIEESFSATLPRTFLSGFLVARVETIFDTDT